MQLTVWEGDFGLISMNIDCVKILLYTKMAQAPIDIKYRKNPFLTYHRKYPIFKDGKTEYTEFSDITMYLRMHSYSIDYVLSSKQCSESYALINLIEVYLKPTLEYLFWIDPKNYDEIISIWHIKAMRFPFNLIYPRLCKKQATKLIESMYPNESNPEVIRSCVFSKANECFSTLATRLGNSDYFFGNTPTTVDAIAYAYLAPLIKIPFATDSIPKMLNNWPVLRRFVKRIDEKFCLEVSSEPKYLIPKALRKKSEEESITASKGTLIFALICVTFAMTSYALAKGIINTEILERYLY